LAPIAIPVSSLSRSSVVPDFFGPPLVPPPQLPPPKVGVACGPNERCVGITAAGLCFGFCVPFTGDPPLGPPVPPLGPPLPPQDNGLPPDCVRVPITGEVVCLGQNGGRRGGCPTTGVAAQKILCPPGCHPNKSDYFLKGGTFVAEGTRCVTNRRRNPLNPRALDRAAGRLRSAQKAVRFLQAAKIPKKRKR